MIDKSIILNVPALPSKTISIPEWGGEVHLLGLTGKQLESLDEGTDQSESHNARWYRMIALSLTNESGERLFIDAEIPEAMEALSRHSLQVIFPLRLAVAELNGLSGVDAMKKNSETSRGDI